MSLTSPLFLWECSVRVKPFPGEGSSLSNVIILLANISFRRNLLTSFACIKDFLHTWNKCAMDRSGVELCLREVSKLFLLEQKAHGDTQMGLTSFASGF